MGYKRCGVACCPSTSTTNGTKASGVSFHRIPCDESQKNGWMDFLSQTNGGGSIVPSDAYICSLHFEPCCFGKASEQGRRSIIKNHFPTLFGGGAKISNNSACRRQTVLEQRNVEPPPPTNEEIISSLREQIQYKDRLISYWKGRYEAVAAELKNTKKKSERQEHQIQRKRKNLEELGNEVVAIKRQKLTLDSVKDEKMKSILHEIVSRQEMKGKGKGQEYSQELKEFAFHMNFKSPKGYSFLRQTMNNSLPHPSTLPNWSKHVDGSPGINITAKEFIKMRVKTHSHKLHYALSFDELSIRSQIVFHNDQFLGYVNYGGILPQPKDPKVAKNALFIMANEINGKDKSQLGYVLTNGLGAAEMSKIIKTALIEMHDCGASVLSITFDGLKSNFSAAEELGAKLDVNRFNVKPYILHPCTREKVFVIPDPIHMFKLLRNTWKSSGIFYSGQHEARWGLLESLVDLQDKEGLRAGNKLTVRHINFEKQPMKVRLAAQSFGWSTACGLSACTDMKIEGFEDTKGTVTFIKLMDRLFDALNSKPGGHGFKAPLRTSNKDHWTKLFKTATNTLMNLKIKVIRKRKVRGRGKKEKYILREEMVFLRSTKRGTPIKGLVIAMKSLIMMMKKVVKPENGIVYLPVYKLCQDVIEIFFACLRSRFGNNNNPNAVQLASAVRDITCCNIIAPKSGNCSYEGDDMSFRLSPLGNFKKLKESLAKDKETASDEDLDETLDVEDLSTFSENVVFYISGFVGRRITAKKSCGNCLKQLTPDPSEAEAMLLREDAILFKEKDNGGLFLPSEFLVTLCRLTESVIREFENKGIHKMKRDKVLQRVLVLWESQKDDDEDMSCKHSSDLIKAIINQYLTVRLHYLAKKTTLQINPESNRNQCTKAVLFAGN